MSSAVTIPEKSDLAIVPVIAEYREILLSPGDADFVYGWMIVGDHLFASTKKAVTSKLVKIAKAEFSSGFTIGASNSISFPGTHGNATYMVRAPSTGLIYVLFPDGSRVLVDTVNPTSLARATVIDDNTNASAVNGFEAMATDDASLFILGTVDGEATLIGYALDDFARTDLTLAGYTMGGVLRYLGGFLYAVGVHSSAPTTVRLLKINGATMTIAGTVDFPSDVTVASGEHIAVTASEVWVGFEDVPSKLYKINSSLVMETVANGAEAEHADVQYDGMSIWDLLEDGQAVRIMNDGAQLTYTLNEGQGFITDIASDGFHVFASWFQSGSKFARYRIPEPSSEPGTVLLSNCSLTGKTIAVDKSITPTAGTIAVGKDGSPFYVYKYSAVPGVPNDSCIVGSQTLQLLPGWPKLIGETISGFFFSDGYPRGIAIDSFGNIIACAGQGPNEQPRATVFIVKLTPDGTTIWQKHNGLVTTGAADAKSVCVDSENNVVVVGNFWGTVNFGGGNITASSGNDVFIAKYSPTGTLLFPVKVFVPSGTAPAMAVGVDGLDNIYVMGQMSGTINFGGATLSTVSNVPYFAKFNSAGTHIFSRLFAGGAQASVGGMAVSSSGIVTFCGQYFNTFDIGGGTMTSPFSGAPTGYVAQYNGVGAALAHRWSKNMADQDSACTCLGCAMDAQGNAILTGTLSGSFDFGSVVLTSAGNRDIYVSKYSPTGINLWATHHGGSAADYGNAVACFANGDVAATGTALVAKIAG